MGLRYLASKPEGNPMHHKRDWSEYNKQLVNRGKINFWVTPKVLKYWKAPSKKKNGRPFIYSDSWIQAISYIRFKYHLSLRETEGFFLSLITLLQHHLQVPSYTQICRRMKLLELPTELLNKRQVTDIVLDTTGLKVYGEGEWRVKKYGGKKRWKKLHIAMDPLTGKIVLAEITDEYVHDTTFLEESMRRTNQHRGNVLIDGIADGRRCYKLAQQYNKRLLTPPKKGAVFRKEPELAGRNDAIKIIRGFGNDRLARSIWAKCVGYNQRVVVESMMSRWKKVMGDSLKSRCSQRIKKEVQIKAMMINMID